MSEMRDRSVVRSSVTASAKYCCSGSLLRFANGSTTIDRRGATACCEIDVVAGGAPATGDMGDDLVAGQTHQAMTAMTSATVAAAAITANAARRRRGASRRTPDADKSAMASGRSA